MNNYLKIFSTIFLSVGLFFSISLFALKIVFQQNDNDKLIVLGPDNENIIIKPKNIGGEKISNLDIEILNNKDALINNEKFRPKPTKPELLPLEGNEIENKSLKKNTYNVTKNAKIYEKLPKDKLNNQKTNKPSEKKKSNILYRVQFGSFRNLDKAKLAKINIEKKFKYILNQIKVEIFSHKNDDNLIFYRVWTTLMKKEKGLKLCKKFQKEDIVCILQVNKS